MVIDEFIENAQKQTLEALTTVQGQVLSLNRSAAGTLGTWLDKLPFASVAKDAWNPAVLDKSFAFASQMVAVNQKFAADLLGAWGSAPQPSKVAK